MKIQTRYRSAYESIGPYGAESFLHAELKQQVRHLLDASAQNGASVSELGSPSPSVEDNNGRTNLVSQFDQILELLARYDEHLADTTRGVSDPSWCTPKVLALVDILLANFHDNFQSIVFVEQRHIATSLAELIGRLPNAIGRLRCAVLLGHGPTDNSSASIRGMPTKVQGDVVQMFRKREINIRE